MCERTRSVISWSVSSAAMSRIVLVEHLPWFRIGGAGAEVPPVTLRHLLTHTAGLPREAAFPYWTDGEFPTAPQIRESFELLRLSPITNT